MEVKVESLLEGAGRARGVAVVIDVFRAFTTAAYAMAGGAEKIIVVRGLDEAIGLKRKNPKYLLMGERCGLKPEGFDYGNSPAEVKGLDFSGRTLVMTTSAGTKGILEARKADEVLLGSFVCANATANYILAVRPKAVTLVPLGSNGLKKTEEDELCAVYLKGLLAGERPDFNVIRKRLWDCKKEYFMHAGPEFSIADFHCAMDLDRFDFALKAVRNEKVVSVIKI